MKPNRKDFLDDLDSDKEWIHTEVLGHNKRKTTVLPMVTFVLVLLCFGLLAYIAFKGGLSGRDLSNLDNMDQVKKAQQNMTDEERALEEAKKKLAEEEASKKQEEADQTLIYTVKSGDTLAAVGDEFGVDYKTIAEANGLEEPYALEVGQELKIPGVKKPVEETAKTPVSTGNEATYTVKEGDSLAAIGYQFGVPFEDIAKLNGIESPYALEVGQVLRIPAKQ